MITINGLPTENNKFSLTQSAKGFVYIERIEVCTNGTNIKQTIDEVFAALNYAIPQLKTINDGKSC